MACQGQGENGLHSVRLLSGVSGGSITACHFVANRQRYLGSFSDAANDLIDFCRETDLRRSVLIKKKSVPDVLRKQLFKESMLLEASPTEIELVVLGTSYKTGDCIVFRRSGISLWRYDTQQARLRQRHEAADSGVYLTKLIQASAAFPPFFPPLKIEPILFSSKPSIETLGELFEDEVADGGIRDNLGFEWYCSAHEPDPSITVLVSDAGQSFDWDATSRLSQGASVWGQRLMRTTDIQMRRLCQTDVTTGSQRFPDAKYVGFADCKDLSAAEDLQKSLWNKPLPRGVANATAKMSTDLTRIGPAQSYAIVRLGFDLASIKFGSHFPERNTACENDGFWKKAFPEAAVRRLLSTSEDDNESLETQVKNEEAPRVQGWVDLWKHIPMSRRQATLIGLLAIIIPVPFLWGLVDIGSVGFRRLKAIFNKPKEFDYSSFVRIAEERDWESACLGVSDSYVTVRGRLLDRRESVVKIELDGLRKIASVEVQDDSKVENLPNDPKPARPYFLVLRGWVTKGGFDTYSLTLTDGKLLETLDERPATW